MKQASVSVLFAVSSIEPGVVMSCQCQPSDWLWRQQSTNQPSAV